MGVYSAAIGFYDGACGVFNIFRNANTETGYSTTTLCNKKRPSINRGDDRKIKK